MLSIVAMVCAMCLLSSCHQFESAEITDYSTYRQEMQDLGYGTSLLPDLDDESCIQDSYFYVKSAGETLALEMLSGFHITYYVKCQYGEDQYHQEEQRLSEYFEVGVDPDDFLLKVNSDLFNYPSFIRGRLYYEAISWPPTIHVNYSYALFDESNFTIVYVDISEYELNGPSTNIPEEYLPKDLVELRHSK